LYTRRKREGKKLGKLEFAPGIASFIRAGILIFMKKPLFKLHSPFAPAGSQPAAIEQLAAGRPGISTLLGVTGSGKTFTIANVIAKQDKPVLILSPNKTLAAQLYEEFSLFFPENKVCYFVSYYDYYQPESYLPAQDIYIPKETKINSEIERLRIESTASLVNRKDTIVIASVSCIYSLGNPSDYKNLAFSLNVGQTIRRDDLIRKLISIQYQRNDMQKESGSFQVVGNSIELNLPYQKEKLRIELLGNTIESLSWVSKLNNTVLHTLDNTVIFPAKHFVTSPERQEAAIISIQEELDATLPMISNPLYRERLKTRVTHDLEMLRETGRCSGIENYSAHFDGRKTGEAPFCLFDFFGDDFLLIIDESHIAIPQLRGMYAGDRARKKALIEFGFRLPSAYDNRPLMFDEIEHYFKDLIFVSATPGDYELQHSDRLVEQIIRPTGLVDPAVIVRPRPGQLDDLLARIQDTTEELARNLQEKQIKVCYLHSELKTPQRTQLLQKLRLGVFDCLVGVNLLREGLDLPEVAFVAIMDGDLESFLRDKRSLIQIIGRAARNTQANVVIYADTITGSMKAALDETSRRRTLQQAYNQEHGITPTTVKRDVVKSISNIQEAIAQASAQKRGKKRKADPTTPEEIVLRMTEIEADMQEAAHALDFEKAIALRDEWHRLKGKV
jgi:excinuclease ABC subunit B